MSGLEKFYSGKTVFVTGHTGFKGGWLSVWLKKLGARVVGYSLAADQGDRGFFSACRVAEGMMSLIADVRDKAALNEALKRHEPDLIFHLAAQPLVLRSYREPIETFETNVMGTAHLLDAARRLSGLRAMVVATSDKCYADPAQPRPRREDDPLGGADPYSASKGAAEIVTASFRSSFFGPGSTTGIASVRAGNVIGGGDWSEARLVPDCMRALTAQEDVIIRNPKSTRPWQHVLDPVRGYLMLGMRLAQEPQQFGGAWNFGPSADAELSAEEIATLALKAWGKTTSRIKINADVKAPLESKALRLDCAKAKRELLWAGLYDAPKAVAATVAWYRAQQENKSFDGLEFSLRQIEEHASASRESAHG